MGLVTIGRLEGHKDLGSKSFIKSENFKLFKGVCFDGGVLVVYFTNGYLRVGFLEQLYGLHCCMS